MAFVRKNSRPKTSQTVSTPRTNDGAELLTVAQLLEIAKRNGVEAVPLDVHALVRVLGIQFLCVPMDDEVSGELRRAPNGKDWVMKVNALHHPNRQRFTIAHELGHFSRHRGGQAEFVDQNFFRNGDSSPMESEANRFAGELLMPEEVFRKYVKLFDGSIEELGKHFKVSTLAVRVRAKMLGMKGHGLE